MYKRQNVLFDTWVHPLVMGLEEHLLSMFRDDFEFNDRAGPSHLGDGASTGAAVVEASPAPAAVEADTLVAPVDDVLTWSRDAEAELHKIPFFVRGKALRNTELFARQTGVHRIEVETIYDARSHFSR